MHFSICSFLVGYVSGGVSLMFVFGLAARYYSLKLKGKI